MTIRLRCPFCLADHEMNERLAGQVVRCPKCQGLFRLPAAPQPQAPARGPALPPPRRQPGERPVVLLAALAGVAGLLVLGLAAVVVAIVVSLRKEPAAAPPENAGAPPAHAGAPPQPQPEEPPRPAAAPAEPGAIPVDPAPAPVMIPDNRAISIPLPNPVELLFPTTESAFVAITENPGDDNVTRTIRDLRDGRPIGQVTVDNKHELFALSPDGKHLAAHVNGEPRQSIDVWSVADGRRVRRIDARAPGYRIFFPCDFAGPGLLLTNQSGANDNLVRIWDVATGQCLRRFQAPVNVFSIKINALSPGRRYMASVHRKNDRLVICDLAASKVIGERLVPDPHPLMVKVPWAATFSPDGRSLHLLSFCGLDLYLATWDVSSERGRTRRFSSVEAMNSPFLLDPANTGTMLQGLADGKVLIAGHALFDPKSGAIVRKLPPPSFQGDVRRVLGTKWARITGPEGNRRLIVEPFPPP